MEKQRIRPIALCLIYRDDCILVEGGADEFTEEKYFRPLGGGIEFGELAADAVVREMREEIGESITDVRLIGIFENIFTLNLKPGHEMVYIFKAEFENPAVYENDSFPIIEPYGISTASWQRVADFEQRRLILYPENLIGFLRSEMNYTLTNVFNTGK